jgi:hypothetical protein
MNKCNVCGYKINTPEEQRLFDLYGCARTQVTSNMGTKIQMCSNDFGTNKFYAPGTDPNEIEEDPEAFKENYSKLLDQKNGNRKK